MRRRTCARRQCRSLGFWMAAGMVPGSGSCALPGGWLATSCRGSGGCAGACMGSLSCMARASAAQRAFVGARMTRTIEEAGLELGLHVQHGLTWMMMAPRRVTCMVLPAMQCLLSSCTAGSDPYRWSQGGSDAQHMRCKPCRSMADDWICIIDHVHRQGICRAWPCCSKLQPQKPTCRRPCWLWGEKRLAGLWALPCRGLPTGSWPVKEGVRERGLSPGLDPAGCSSLGAGAVEDTDSPAELADSCRVGEPASSCAWHASVHIAGMLGGGLRVGKDEDGSNCRHASWRTHRSHQGLLKHASGSLDSCRPQH